ncbi:MAG: hypothetical protein AAF648_05140 [Pseudomonadota bacterium]
MSTPVLFAVAAVLFLVGACALGYVWLRRHDGPVGPLPGGPLRRGQLHNGSGGGAGGGAGAGATLARRIGTDGVTLVELQLDGDAASRMVGVFIHAGSLYLSCDLGFVGFRAPGTTMRVIQHLVVRLKRWHRRLGLTGRLTLRIDDERFRCRAVRVTDSHQLETLKAIVATNAIAFFGAPLRDPGRRPGTIRFFQLHPESSGTAEP